MGLHRAVIRRPWAPLASRVPGYVPSARPRFGAVARINLGHLWSAVLPHSPPAPHPRCAPPPAQTRQIRLKSTKALCYVSPTPLTDMPAPKVRHGLAAAPSLIALLRRFDHGPSDGPTDSTDRRAVNGELPREWQVRGAGGARGAGVGAVWRSAGSMRWWDGLGLGGLSLYCRLTSTPNQTCIAALSRPGRRFELCEASGPRSTYLRARRW